MRMQGWCLKCGGGGNRNNCGCEPSEVNNSAVMADYKAELRLRGAAKVRADDAKHYNMDTIELQYMSNTEFAA